MLLVPQSGDVKVISNAGIVGTATPGTAVPDGAANAYGVVTELIAAAANTQDSWGIEITVTRTEAVSAVATEMAVDILVGGATDDVLIRSLLVGGAFYGGPRSYYFPVHVPAGKRVAARLASFDPQATESVVLVHLYGGCDAPGKVGRKVTTYGTKINDARGLAVVPAASGAAALVTEMSASTTEDHFYFLPGFQVSVDTTITPATFVNVGIGLGADPPDRLPLSWWFSKNAAESQSGPHPRDGVYRDVPAATRLTMLSSNGGANDSNMDGHIYAVS